MGYYLPVNTYLVKTIGPVVSTCELDTASRHSSSSRAQVYILRRESSSYSDHSRYVLTTTALMTALQPFGTIVRSLKERLSRLTNDVG